MQVASAALVGLLAFPYTGFVLWARTPLVWRPGDLFWRFQPIANAVIFEERDPWHMSVVYGIDVAGMRWHVVYLAGLIVLVAWVALRQHGASGRLRWLAIGGLIALVAGAIGQMATPQLSH
jgi:hypothetical protein